jgi:hypothetical protein
MVMMILCCRRRWITAAALVWAIAQNDFLCINAFVPSTSSCSSSILIRTERARRCCPAVAANHAANGAVIILCPLLTRCSGDQRRRTYSHPTFLLLAAVATSDKNNSLKTAAAPLMAAGQCLARMGEEWIESTRGDTKAYYGGPFANAGANVRNAGDHVSQAAASCRFKTGTELIAEELREAATALAAAADYLQQQQIADQQQQASGGLMLDNNNKDQNNSNNDGTVATFRMPIGTCHFLVWWLLSLTTPEGMCWYGGRYSNKRSTKRKRLSHTKIFWISPQLPPTTNNKIHIILQNR